jgi:hypothetical protein
MSVTFVGLAVGLIICGLVIVVLCGKTGNALLGSVLWWIGVVLVVIGVVLLVTPVFVWFSGLFKSWLGQG